MALLVAIVASHYSLGEILLRKVFLALSLIDKRSRTLVIVFSLIRVLISGLDTLGVILIGLLLSKSATQILDSAESSSSNFMNFSNILQRLTITQTAIAALVLFLAKSILSIVFTKTMAQVLAAAESDVASKTYINLLKGRYRNFSNFSSQDLVYALNYSASSAISGTLNISVSILSESTLLIAMGMIFLLVDTNVALAIIVYFSLIGYLIYRIIGPKMQSIGSRFSETALSSSTALNDSVIAFRELFTLKKQNEFIQKFSKGRVGFAKANAYASFYGSLPRYIVESTLLLGAVFLSSYVFTHNQTSVAVGILGVFLTGSMRMTSSLLPLQNSLNSLRQLIAQSESFFNLIEKTKSPNEMLDLEFDYKNPVQVPVSVIFNDVTFNYPDTTLPALKNVSLKIAAGEYIALIGPSGAGKSTIADLMIKLIDPTTGSVSFENIDPKFARIGYVPQSPGIVSGTILENITLNVYSHEYDKERLTRALEGAHLDTLIRSLKNGVNTDLGAQSDALSGGQMQRIGLARALYTEPGLLVLDEATSALDAETESAISESLNSLRGKCTIVVIAHRMSTVQNADCVYVIEDGRIVDHGKFNELAKTNNLVARYVELSQLNVN